MNGLTLFIGGFIALGGGIFLGYFARQTIAKQQEGTAEAKINKLLNDANTKAQSIVLQARDKAAAILEEVKKEEQEGRRQIEKIEQRVSKREELADSREEGFTRREQELRQKAEQVREVKEKIDALQGQKLKELERVSNLSVSEAKEELIKNVEKSYELELRQRLEKLEEYGKDQLDQRARDIIATAIQRYASSQATELTTTIVNLPNDEIKGRIIGKEGRNIRALEKLTGVEFIIDDTPEAIVISGFDTVRRHVAKLALEKLISDGRIQPARIEEAVAKAKEDISDKIREAGEAAIYDAGIVGVDPKLVWLLGRLRYRTSYGQNVLMHSLEVCHLAGALAAELGADIAVAKKAGLFHDIGKAIDHEVEGSHVDIGRNILKKFGMQEEVVVAMQAHHEEYPYESIEARIVQAADAISAARPGARKDSLENYLRRLSELEGVATAFSGVEKAYAIQAGREVRVFVTPEEIDDTQAQNLARDIANRIHEELKYPGEIKVVVIRETRAVEYAR